MDGISAPAFFNRLKNGCIHDYVLYLGEGFNLYDSSTIDILETYLNKYHSGAGFGAVYSDSVIMIDGNAVCPQFKPAYDIRMKNHGFVFNVPFAVKAKNSTMPIFNEDISKLYLWDGLLNLSSSYLLFQIPRTLFTIDNAFSVLDVAEDIQNVKKHYFKS